MNERQTVSKDQDTSHRENKFAKEQPLRHPLAVVMQNEDQLQINHQVYRVLVDKQAGLDLEMLRQKYDPYLDQYDFIVGDVSSGHLRLKGFYQDKVRTALDRKQQTIADYLLEYCNPGGSYFILQLLDPVHHYHTNNKKNHARGHHRNGPANTRHSSSANFRKRRVRQTRFKKQTVAIKSEQGNHHAFVIKKRKSSN
ncbi:YutD family protein [Lactobacillus sp. ESL0681]|uniref:YutD family protein n=1 Tax=Lactobacillus sp. ESL0681 TaxID=2983211 RepID=UPI0023F6AD1A|nr:YutD family protein [Lactobacillus sp. ESL0681]WEV40194.1 YutD family protein [Lactobacillus sp. ESL0681]